MKKILLILTSFTLITTTYAKTNLATEFEARRNKGTQNKLDITRARNIVNITNDITKTEVHNDRVTFLELKNGSICIEKLGSEYTSYSCLDNEGLLSLNRDVKHKK